MSRPVRHTWKWFSHGWHAIVAETLLLAYAVTAVALPGDVDGNGIIDTADRNAIINHLLNVAPLTEPGLSAADANQDGALDVRDVVFVARGSPDTDQDGLPDVVETALGLAPENPDTDGDNVQDGDEDYDSDGLSNLSELNQGLDPALPDSDGDGFYDAAELNSGTDPLSPSVVPVGIAASPLVSYRYLAPANATQQTESYTSSSPVSYRYLAPANIIQQTESYISSSPVSYRYLAPANTTQQTESPISSSPVSYRYLSPPLPASSPADALALSPPVSYDYLQVK